MPERRLPLYDVRTWIRNQLIVHAFIGRRVRLFIHIPDSRIVQHYQNHQPAIRESMNEAVGEHIRRLSTERQVNRRLPNSSRISGRKVSLISHRDLRACKTHAVASSGARGRWPLG